MNATADDFNNQTTGIEKAISRIALRFIFNKAIGGNLKPVVGYVVEVTNVVNNKTEK